MYIVVIIVEYTGLFCRSIKLFSGAKDSSKTQDSFAIERGKNIVGNTGLFRRNVELFYEKVRALV